MRFLLTVFLLFFVSTHWIVGQGAYALYRQGDTLRERGEYQQAQVFYERATEAFLQKKEYENTLKARLGVSYTLLKSNAAQKSIAYSNESIAFAKQNSPKSLLWQYQNQQYIAEALMLLGKYEQSKEILKSTIEQLKNQNNGAILADSYTLLGILYWQEGSNNLSLEYLENGLEIRKNEQLPDTVSSYNDLGLVYQGINPKISLQYYEKVAKNYRLLYPALHPKNALIASNIGILDNSLGKYESALFHFEKAKNIWQEIYPNSHPNEAFVRNNIGSVLVEKGKYKEAISYFEQALGIYSKNYGENHPEIAKTYNLIARAYLKDNNSTKALLYIQKSFIANSEVFRSLGSAQTPNSQGNMLSNSTFLYTLMLKIDALNLLYTSKSVRLKDIKNAFVVAQVADTLLSRIRQNVVSNADKLQLGQISATLYEKSVALCLLLAEETKQRQKYFEQAFYFSEKAKSVVLLEAIGESKAKAFGNISAALLTEEDSLKAEITFLEQQIAQKPQESILNTYKTKLFELNRRYEGFQKKLETSYPEYYNLKYNTQVTSLASLQTALGTQKSLISYMIGSSNMYVFVIDKHSIHIESIDNKEDIEKNITFLLNSIRFRSRLFHEMAFRIYKDIFPRKYVKHAKELVIVQDGKLGMLPMEVLLSERLNDKKGLEYDNMPFLINKYSFSYAYSATLWYQNGEKNSQTQGKNMILVAPVNFSEGINDLPGTEKEVQEISKVCANNQFSTKVLFKQDAQEEKFKSLQLQNYSILHFATHGLVNEENPELSQIFLNNSLKDDGNLFAGEIYNLRLQADLVTLSACEVGLGKLSKGEGIIGLSRAFLYAGAKNLIVSLWRVSDESTALLMSNFYKNHFESKRQDYGEALRAAKLTLIKGKEFAQPYFWGAFILLGK